jgi:hypothetical protein
MGRRNRRRSLVRFFFSERATTRAIIARVDADADADAGDGDGDGRDSRRR